MAILNPKEEQIIGEDDDKQYQARRKRTRYSEAETLFMQAGNTQFQQRTSPLTNREVLSIAADSLKLKGLTDGERSALDIFKKRLDTLRELEDKRITEGRTYKEQQFGSNVDREAAKKTLERMKVLDEQIKRASSSVLDVEKKEVLKRVLESSRKVIETQERAHGRELLNSTVFLQSQNLGQPYYLRLA